MSIEEKVNHIPGMVEPIEQKNLFDLAKNLELKEGDCLIEFGTFFGKSTFCISEGLLENKTYNKSIKFYAYDSFKCHKDGRFKNSVLDQAKNANLLDLVKYEEKYIDFLNIFKHFLQEHIKSNSVEWMQFDLKNSFPKSKNDIKLIHIDSPKFFDEFKIICERFFPLMKDKSIIIFQDYFFHWSATLIASVQFLIEKKTLSIVNSSATSLTTLVFKQINIKIIEELKNNMKNTEFVLEMIDKAILNTNNYSIDRPHVFVPRLLIARFQFLWSLKLYDKATAFLFNYVKRNHNRLNQSTLNDFGDLMKNGFSIRKLYEKDYS